MGTKKICKRCGKEFESEGRFPLCDSCKVAKCVICGKAFTPKYPYDGLCCSNQCRAELRKKTNMERYGVENPSQLQSVKDKIAATFDSKYCGSPMRDPEVKAKVAATSMERYGVPHAAQNTDIKKKGVNTLIRNHGGVGYSSAETRSKIVSTNRSRYGADTPFESEAVQSIIKQVNLERYGYENPMLSDKVKERLHSTFEEKYGDWAIAADVVRDKIVDTVRERYGVDCVLSSEEVRRKIADTNVRLYGTEHPSQTEAVQQKARRTTMEKYGVPYYTATDEYRKNAMLDSSKIEQYLCFLNDPVCYIECNFTTAPTAHTLAESIGVSDSLVYALSHTLDFWDHLEHHYSNMESEVEQLLISMGVTDIVHNDRSVIKPLEIDLYIPSKRIGIECNPTDTHNSSFPGPFDEPPKDYQTRRKTPTFRYGDISRSSFSEISHNR